MEAIETIEHAGFTIKVYQDTDTSAPEDNGNTDLFLITTSNRYFEVKRKGFDMDSARDGDYKKDYHVLALNAYIHSGVALSLGTEYPFGDLWDSGQIGYVLVQKRAGFRNIRTAAESLISEWNSYLAGEVYGYVVEDSDGEHVDSCWGFVGDIKYCIGEAKQAAEYEAKHRAAEDTKIDTMMAL